MKSKSGPTVLTRKKSAGGILDTIKTIVYAVLIALVVRTVAYEPFNIPSGSMVPTLLVGDYLFVSKFSYGYSRYSLPFGLPLFPGRIFFHSPEQEAIAKKSREALEASSKLKRPIATEITPAATFYRAEEYHQKYLQKRGVASCHF